MSPLETLATALAYVVDADKKASVEEKAQMVAILHKHVSRGDIGQQEMREISSKAFQTIKVLDVDSFLARIAPGLPSGQRLAILINLYDMMLSDGQTADGELRIIQKFERAFEVDMPTMQVLREVMILKNDASIFSGDLNPRNESSYTLKLSMTR